MKNWVDILRDTDSLKTFTIEVTDAGIVLDNDFDGEEVWLSKSQAEFLVVRLQEAIRLISSQAFNNCQSHSEVARAAIAGSNV